MTNILQPLDCTCCGVTKPYFRTENRRAFAAGFQASKRSFFQTYLSIRSRAFTEYIINGGWKRAGIHRRDNHLVIRESRLQMNLPLNDSSSGTLPVEENDVSAEQVVDENITASVSSNLTWRGAQVSLLSGNTQIAIAACELYYDQS